jgi:hemerythrin-like domain-containing protein
MKRSAALTLLSHDHHHALVVAQRLRRAEDRSPATRELLDFWESQGREHFDVEEEVLVPTWLELDPGADRALAERLADEHQVIRSLVRAAQSDSLDLDGLAETGRLLADHVRFEERELFPLIEKALRSDALATLGEEIGDHRAPGRGGS